MAIKTLSTYTEKLTSELFERHGVFFAFGDKQFNEQKKEGVVYSQLGAGMFAPSCNAKTVVVEMREIYEKGREQDLQENGKKAIIRRELFNFECFYVCDYTEALEPLAAYGITESEVSSVFNEIRLTEADDLY